MTPKEVVTRSIEFRRPARLAINGFGPLNDTDGIGYDRIMPPQANGQEGVDQFLCRWEKTATKNMGQVKGHPLLDLAAMKDFPWPDGTDPRRYEVTVKQLAELQADPIRRDKYVFMGIGFVLWERMHMLHGFENCMVDLMDDSPALHELADRILDYNIATIRSMHRVCGSAIQGFTCTEDWGTQLDLHISPELWRRFFFDRYKKMFAAIHECGWHVWVHSCGKINKALPMFIEAGLDVINMQQPLTNGIEEIGSQFAGRLCFETLCDIQMTLPGGDRAAIAAQARELLRHWATPDGGFILGDYGDPVGIGTAAETKQFMLESFQSIDPYAHGAGFWK